MARVNSIAIGKGSGKLGNVVFQSYHGGTYARQKNDTITTPPTDAQIKQQNIMYNCSRAGSFVLDFFRNFKAKNQGNLSFSAYWAKLTSQSFSNFRALRGFQSVRQLAGLSFGENYLIQIDSIELIVAGGVKTGARVYFSPQIEQWEDNYAIHIMCTNIVMSGGNLPISTVNVQDKQITLQDWVNGFIEIQVEDFDTQFVIAYGRQSYTYSCNMLFSEIFE